MRGDLHRGDRVVELVTATHGLRLLPAACVRIKRIAEVLFSAILHPGRARPASVAV